MKIDIKDKVCYATTKEYGECKVTSIEFDRKIIWIEVDFSNDGDESDMREVPVRIEKVVSIEFV